MKNRTGPGPPHGQRSPRTVRASFLSLTGAVFVRARWFLSQQRASWCGLYTSSAGQECLVSAWCFWGVLCVGRPKFTSDYRTLWAHSNDLFSLLGSLPHVFSSLISSTQQRMRCKDEIRGQRNRDKMYEVNRTSLLSRVSV